MQNRYLTFKTNNTLKKQISKFDFKFLIETISHEKKARCTATLCANINSLQIKELSEKILDIKIKFLRLGMVAHACNSSY
jgi:hypothetical protein